MDPLAKPIIRLLVGLVVCFVASGALAIPINTTLPGDVRSAILDTNIVGQAVGVSCPPQNLYPGGCLGTNQFPNQVPGWGHAFLWSNGTLGALPVHDFGPPTHSALSTALAINDAGEIVGGEAIVEPDITGTGFEFDGSNPVIWKDGQIEYLPYPVLGVGDAYASDIDNFGRVLILGGFGDFIFNTRSGSMMEIFPEDYRGLQLANYGLSDLPEPNSLALIAVALASVAWFDHKRRRSHIVTHKFRAAAGSQYMPRRQSMAQK